MHIKKKHYLNLQLQNRLIRPILVFLVAHSAASSYVLYVHHGPSAASSLMLVPISLSLGPTCSASAQSSSPISNEPFITNECQFLGNQAGTRVIGAKCHLNANEQVSATLRAQKIPVYILKSFLGLTRLYWLYIYILPVLRLCFILVHDQD